MRKKSLSRLSVRARPGEPAKGWLTANGIVLPVALGRSGIKANKREGDGATPRGTLPPQAAVVARRQARASGDAVAVAPDRSGRRLVRGSARPPL